MDEFSNDSDYNKEYKAQLIKQLTEANNKLSRARELLLIGDLEPSDYKTIKTECEDNIIRMEAKRIKQKSWGLILGINFS